MPAFFDKRTLAFALCVMAAGHAMATDGLVIRGGTCSADAFKKGAELAQDDTITNLSANCTSATNNKANFAAYTAGIAGPNFCVATMIAVQKNSGKVKLDPKPGNPLHCLVSGKASELAGVLTRR
ncbi:hypothetical protein F2P45_29625 [Massilia sp. CCM 8733]|uniref:Uncharacterized protein n=1 Tax=Massilia mucilaginosa TaxID=2609282 RepID=A0ABX0P2F4_9BURK|nr:hypothetical protein [Massilia mucilaginosa]NHZ93139.1 hypothetical protein [Massilia mucilaginosa]